MCIDGSKANAFVFTHRRTHAVVTSSSVSFPSFFNDIPGTRTDCHMTRLVARRYETRSTLAVCTVGKKKFPGPVAWNRVSSC